MDWSPVWCSGHGSGQFQPGSTGHRSTGRPLKTKMNQVWAWRDFFALRKKHGTRRTILSVIFRDFPRSGGGHNWSILVFMCFPVRHEAKGFRHSFSGVKRIPAGAIFVPLWSPSALPGLRKQKSSRAAPAPPTTKTRTTLWSGVHGRPPGVLGFRSALGARRGLPFWIPLGFWCPRWLRTPPPPPPCHLPANVRPRSPPPPGSGH